MRMIFLTMPCLLIIFKNAFSCDCVMQPVEKYIDTSQFILIVKSEVILDTFQYPYIEPDSKTGFTSRVKVIEILKNDGSISDKEIYFGSDYSDCAMKFRVGEKYLLFAYKNGDKYYVYHCSYCDRYNKSIHNLKKIRKYLKRNSTSKHSRLSGALAFLWLFYSAELPRFCT